MKLFSAVLRRKRGIFLFVAAFILPLLFVVVLSIDTFSKRQDTTRNLLETNLGISGRSALTEFENYFFEIEKKSLEADRFRSFLSGYSLPEDLSGLNLFLLDKDFQIVLPRTGQEKDFLVAETNISTTEYNIYLKMAESAEYSSRNFSKAILNYKNCQMAAQIDKQRAYAIKGLARCYLASRNFTRSIEQYQVLISDYSQIENQAGHPYGIASLLELFSIRSHLSNKTRILQDIFDTYKKIRDGYWALSASGFKFFMAEFESILDTESGSNMTSADNDSYQALKKALPKYTKVLEYHEFLRQNVVPQLKGRFALSGNQTIAQPRRILAGTGESQYLVSCKELAQFDDGQSYYGGIRLNLDYIITHIVSSELDRMMNETQLRFLLVDEYNTNILTGETGVPENSLALSFENLPLPWKLIAIQTGYEKLNTDKVIQVVVYGLLLIIIIILMFFGVFMLMRDISREADSMLIKTEFVHNVSHELKTPLSLIRLYGETLLLKENLPVEDRRDALQIITKESERLSHMINNILDFSKIEMGRKEFDMKTDNLAELVKNTMDSYRYHLEKKGFTIEEMIDQNIIKVLFDKNAVEGILINLLSNAIKFSPDNKRVTVRLRSSDDAYCLEVADQGIGIRADELPHIFDRFYRAKNNSDYEARGSGLGLTLVKHVVDAHGWKIEVESTPEQGSLFSIIIPLTNNGKELS